jgi:YfiH family protein
MGRGGEAGQREGGEVGAGATTVTEVPSGSSLPLYDVPGWQERYGVIAGITGRGKDPGRGFDLGLWSKEPVGEVMSRWLAFRRGMSQFPGVALGNQVHGTEIMTLTQGTGWIQADGIDGWVTTTPGILLTVTIADCVPVYLVAPGRGVGLLHAGWRGTAGRILARGAERLRSIVGASTDIVMHCGVGICGKCYEVGSEVMSGCGAPAPGTGPWHLDLRSCLVEQGASLGLKQATISSWCSAHDRSTFFSHRASGGTDGRMVAYLGIPKS